MLWKYENGKLLVGPIPPRANVFSRVKWWCIFKYMCVRLTIASRRNCDDGMFNICNDRFSHLLVIICVDTVQFNDNNQKYAMWKAKQQSISGFYFSHFNCNKDFFCELMLINRPRMKWNMQKMLNVQFCRLVNLNKIVVNFWFDLLNIPNIPSIQTCFASNVKNLT